MTSHRALARQALLRALSTRKKVGLASTSPLCPFDLAEKLAVEVRFVDIPNIEGMYVKRIPPLILVAADRPAGRRRSPVRTSSATMSSAMELAPIRWTFVMFFAAPILMSISLIHSRDFSSCLRLP